MNTIVLGLGSPVDIGAAKAQVAAEIKAMAQDPPARLEFGVKIVIVAVCTLVRLFDKHREHVLVDFPPIVVGALDVLVASCPALEALNFPGPR